MDWAQSSASLTDRGPAAGSTSLAGTMPAGMAEHPDYQVIRELGRGGMGVVYLAHNRLLGRNEVLKVMSRHIMERPGLLARFMAEMRAVGAFHNSMDARLLNFVRPDVPSELAAVVAKMMAKEPGRRFQTPATVAQG